MADQIRTDYLVLQAFTADLFQSAGLNQEDAAYYSKSLVDTNLYLYKAIIGRIVQSETKYHNHQKCNHAGGIRWR